MSKTILTFLLLVTTYSLYAQMVIGSQGDTYSNSNVYIDFTIGEVVSNTNSDGNNYVIEGIHQPSWNFVGIYDQDAENIFVVYPNPTNDLLKISTQALDDLSYSLFDAQGKCISNSSLISEQTEISLHALEQGNYTLVLEQNGIKLKAFNIIKNQ